MPGQLPCPIYQIDEYKTGVTNHVAARPARYKAESVGRSKREEVRGGPLTSYQLDSPLFVSLFHAS